MNSRKAGSEGREARVFGLGEGLVVAVVEGSVVGVDDADLADDVLEVSEAESGWGGERVMGKAVCVGWERQSCARRPSSMRSPRRILGGWGEVRWLKAWVRRVSIV